jgi:hypothetical protein
VATDRCKRAAHGRVLRSTGALILRLTYGYTATTNNDPLVNVVEEAMHGFSVASEPGAFWVDK